jgi:hypothetical protein
MSYGIGVVSLGRGHFFAVFGGDVTLFSLNSRSKSIRINTKLKQHNTHCFCGARGVGRVNILQVRRFLACDGFFF